MGAHVGVTVSQIFPAGGEESPPLALRPHPGIEPGLDLGLDPSRHRGCGAGAVGKPAGHLLQTLLGVLGVESLTEDVAEKPPDPKVSFPPEEA